jgi:hypothetical protein
MNTRKGRRRRVLQLPHVFTLHNISICKGSVENNLIQRPANALPSRSALLITGLLFFANKL